MADSLILAGIYECIGATTNPEVRLTAEQGDLGAPEPDTATIVGRFLDGDRQTGDRSGDRSITIPLHITGDERAVIVDQIRQIVDAEFFTIEHTPEDTGLTTIYTGKRGKVTRTRNRKNEQQGVTHILIEAKGDPFGRSRDLQFIDLNAGTAAQIQLDPMDSGTFTNLTLDLTRHWEGAGSAKGTLTRLDGALPVPLKTQTYQDVAGFGGRALPGGAEDLTGYGSVGVRFRWPAPTGKWTVHLLLLLKSSGVTVAGLSRVITAREGDGRWRLVRFGLSEALDLTAVDEWALIPSFDALKYLASRPATSDFWVDDLRALPAASNLNTTTEGAQIVVPNVMGSARVPANFELTKAAAMTGILVHRPPTDQDPDARILMQLDGTDTDAVAVAADNARYEGTYSPVLLRSALGSGTRTVTVTATQSVDGDVVGTVVATRTYDDDSFDGKFLTLEDMTLPPVKVPEDCTTSTITFGVATTSSGSTSTWLDLCLLHTEGDTLIVGVLPTDTLAVYIDEPEPVTGLGHVYASLSDRSAAFSVLAQAETLTGGPMSLDPGDNQLVVLTPEGRPDVLVPYRPAWMDERVS